MLEKGFYQYIRSIELKRDKVNNNYPFSLEAVKALEMIELHPNATIYSI